ncbi:hypothetical protein PoB_003227400 [Plakobranchus ocellatus]|uniref:Uncharacterized protein n=1 Tax=Plakobranchus ocellatus TaxID=259542 RepID=A0AAV4AH63_9GAST|nr:hypothetical protein PoB_003227400 [Plakobranchus ocellatus]
MKTGHSDMHGLMVIASRRLCLGYARQGLGFGPGEGAWGGEGEWREGLIGAIGGIVDSELTQGSAGIILFRVRVLPPAPWSSGGHESLRLPCYGLAILKDRPRSKAKLDRFSLNIAIPLSSP